MIGKKIKINLSLSIFVIICLCLAICINEYFSWPKQNSKPFNTMDKMNITQIKAIYSVYPNYNLSQEEQNVLKNLLQDITIFSIDNSYTEYDGVYSLMFELETSKGKTINISASPPFFFINGVAYKTSYEPCHKVSEFYWDIVDTKIRPLE